MIAVCSWDKFVLHLLVVVFGWLVLLLLKVLLICDVIFVVVVVVGCTKEYKEAHDEV